MPAIPTALDELKKEDYPRGLSADAGAQLPV